MPRTSVAKVTWSWDPLKHTDEEPTPRCLARVQKDIADFNATPPPCGIFIAPDDVDITKISALLIGPTGTPYENGFFQFFK
ncbi:hypothetical protein HPB52_017449 [Rhipicephalus sanguineus]|uniref:UBC core domain-containing protein n=1 Tax=Rhipicephalus sanguineus TaxID=34632 RepID=A0A9D4SQQ1_RHISA|nr:hypothetical protein HPB52_017449 [Rhipicephalus sanguineus]